LLRLFFRNNDNQMYLLPVLVMLHMTSPTSMAEMLTVEVGAESWGAFQTLEQPANRDGVYILKDGWVRNGFFEIWWGEGTGDPEVLTPGRHVRNADDCESYAVTISQGFGAALRQRKRSWTLIDACPVAWVIKEETADSELLHLTELTIIAKEIGVAR
jgi:hypothetical protein